MRKSRTRRSSSIASEYYFDAKAANLVKLFFERCCTHSKGRWAGQPFTLAKWQWERVVKPLFGWKRKKDGLRKYRTCYIEIPKKNGKSTLGSALALYLTFGDGEPGAEVYSAAATKEQAAIVFNEARTMGEANDELSELGDFQRRSIYVPSTKSVYRVLSSDAGGQDGLNSHGVIFDEFHWQPDRELYKVLDKSTAAREQPIQLYITTAGTDKHSICGVMHDYAEKVASGNIEAPSFLPVIFKADEADDWTSPKVWRKANPSLGVTVLEEYLAEKCQKAQDAPSEENEFRRFHLNQWVKQDVRWMPMMAWNECGGEVNEADLIGRTCYSGLDLSTTTDVTALVHVFVDGQRFKVLPRFWIPEEGMEKRIRKDRVPYDVWERQGYLKATSGNVIDYDWVLEQIDQDAKKFDFKVIAFDDWGATKIIQEIERRKETLELYKFRQGFKSMSHPTKELLNLVLARRLEHGNHPVLTWMADNVVVEMNAPGDIKPNKQKSIEKIDGIVALIMALDVALRFEGLEVERSIYEERGLSTVG